MSCPKCEPKARAQRWFWWAAIAALLAAGAWLDHARGTPAPDGSALQSAAR